MRWSTDSGPADAPATSCWPVVRRQEGHPRQVDQRPVPKLRPGIAGSMARLRELSTTIELDKNTPPHRGRSSTGLVDREGIASGLTDRCAPALKTGARLGPWWRWCPSAGEEPPEGVERERLYSKTSPARSMAR